MDNLIYTRDSSKLYGISGDGAIILSGGGLEGGITTTVGSDIIGQGVSFGLAAKTPGVEATTSITKTIIVIEMNPSPELLYEIRYRKSTKYN